MDSVSIIIVNYNGRGFIGDCLSSIKETASGSKEIAEIIVVDNASADGSPEFIEKEYPDIKMIGLEENKGFAEANNIGVRTASGGLIIFLNSDTAVTPGWLAPLIEAMRSNPEVGVAGSKLLLMGAPGRVNSAGADIVPTGGAYDIGFMDEDSEKYNVSGFRGAVSAAAMVVRKNEFLSLGGFDAFYFMYFEDVDLCWRYWLSGRKVLYVPNSVVYHKFGGSAGSDRFSPLRVFYGTRNTLLNAIKHFGPYNLLKALILNVSFHSVTMLKLFLRGRLRSGLAVIRAYASLIGHLPITIKTRGIIQGGRKVADKYLFDNSLIVSLAVARKEMARLWRAFR